MNSEWGKNILLQSHYFSTHLMGLMGHTFSTILKNEDGLQQFMMSFAWFSDYSIIRRKTWEIHYSCFSTTKQWFQNDWSNDQVL